MNNIKLLYYFILSSKKDLINKILIRNNNIGTKIKIDYYDKIKIEIEIVRIKSAKLRFLYQLLNFQIILIL